MDVQIWRMTAPVERPRVLLQSNLRNLDSVAFISCYRQFIAAAKEKNDLKSGWVLDFLRFKNRRTLNFSQEQTFSLLADLEKKAMGEDWPVEVIVARHYAQFERFNEKKITLEPLYAHLLNEFSQMQELGFERFQDYDISDLMYHSGEFMFHLEDYDNALQFLLVGEHYMTSGKTRYHTLVLTLNHIQAIYQQQKDYTRGIEYAQKILRITDSIRLSNSESAEFCRFWKCLATIDVASMLILQRKFAEGEKFADQGYALMTAVQNGSVQEPYLEGEYNALMPLISIKLELKKIADAEVLLRRADSIWAKIGYKEYNYFKQIKLWEAHAQIAEIRGDYAASMRYTRLAKPLQDSLARQTDSRKLDKIKQRVESKKYAEKIRLIEHEKLVQTRLLYAALLGLLGLAFTAYWNYRRLQIKRGLAVAKLEAYLQEVLEKTAQGTVRAQENGDVPNPGERSRYLQELLQSTILTEQDWVQFRALFEKVYPNFMEEQKTLYADLTQAELRYLVMEKLQLNTQEMARMLGVSDGTIRQTRFRLRKKQL
ncbi:MAG: hypothetical protein JNJ90_09315 [Saprospiraceae bacterium]|nr:hypothetical protein [Saprospiraceae bacterium]